MFFLQIDYQIKHILEDQILFMWNCDTFGCNVGGLEIMMFSSYRFEQMGSLSKVSLLFCKTGK